MNEPLPVECAPILASKDLSESVRFYRLLGFSVSWDPGYANEVGRVHGYAFARYGRAALHIAENPDLVVEENTRSAFLVIGDPDWLAQKWKALGLRVMNPWDGFSGYWGMLTDSDRNSLFFGRPAVPPGEEHNGRPA